MAGRYALALFSLAREGQATDQVAAALKTFSGMIAESPDLERLVRSPVFSAEDQVKALGALLDKAGITGVAANPCKAISIYIKPPKVVIHRRTQRKSAATREV